MTLDSCRAAGEEIVIKNPGNGGRLVTGASEHRPRLFSKLVPNGNDDEKQAVVKFASVDDDFKVDQTSGSQCEERRRKTNSADGISKARRLPFGSQGMSPML